MAEAVPGIAALRERSPLVARLLDRMQADGDFPAMSAQIVRVLNLAGGEREDLRHLTEEILKDVALTNKLLRVVNAARFAGHVDGIGTVSRAVSMMGVSTVRSLALSLVLLEHMENRLQAQRVREEYLRALLAAHLAVALGAPDVDPEEAFLGALFHELGRMIAVCYFPTEVQTIDARAGRDRDAVRREAVRVLGADFEALGQGVARVWGLPAHIRRAMEPAEGTPPSRRPHEAGERLRWLSGAAHAMAEAMLGPTADAATPAWERVSRRFSGVLGVGLEAMALRAESARQRWSEAAEAAGLGRVHAAPVGVAPSASGPPPPAPAVVQDGDMNPAATTLAQGLADVTDVLLEGAPPKELGRMALETLYRALGYERAVLCRRTGPSGPLQGWIGLGADAEALVPQFQVSLGDGDDVLGAMVRSGKDSCVEDVQRAAWSARLPAWLRSDRVRGLLVLPLCREGVVVGMLYADRSTPGGPVWSDEDRALVRALRNLVVYALASASALRG